VSQWLAGWFLGAYFLGGFSEDGRGMNGLPKGVIATAKSWAVGIPVSWMASYVKLIVLLGKFNHPSFHNFLFP